MHTTIIHYIIKIIKFFYIALNLVKIMIKETWFISYKPCHHSTTECFSKQHMESVIFYNIKYQIMTILLLLNLQKMLLGKIDKDIIALLKI